MNGSDKRVWQVNRADIDFARYYSLCEDLGKRFTWNGFADWLRREREGKQGQLWAELRR